MYACSAIRRIIPHRAIARASLDKLLVIKEDEAYCQPCVSPVWDTALVCPCAARGRRREGGRGREQGLDWLKPLQVLDVKGDWIARRPNVRPGRLGVPVRQRALSRPRRYRRRGDGDGSRAGASAAQEFDAAIDRAREWIVGLQSHDGGCGAFDADNDYHYLNNIPFADHGALLDPPTADLTGRCLSMLAQLGERPDDLRADAPRRSPGSNATSYLTEAGTAAGA